MKIGIITFHLSTNYGAYLQAYALQHLLEKLGYDVDMIDYQPEVRRNENRILKHPAKKNLKTSYIRYLLGLGYSYYVNIINLDQYYKRKKYFIHSRLQNLHLSPKKYYSLTYFWRRLIIRSYFC